MKIFHLDKNSRYFYETSVEETSSILLNGFQCGDQIVIFDPKKIVPEKKVENLAN